jgi:hypothetical protein
LEKSAAPLQQQKLLCHPVVSFPALGDSPGIERAASQTLFLGERDEIKFMRAQNPCLGRAWWAFLIASIKKKEKMCHMTLTGRRCGTGVLSDLVDVVLSFLGERLTAPGHFFAFFRRM